MTTPYPESRQNAQTEDQIHHYQPAHRRIPRIGTPLLKLLETIDRVFDRVYSSKYNPIYQTGPLVVAMLLVMLVTGLYLFLFYRTDQPYESMRAIQEQLWFGRWIRSLHRYSADASIILVFLHALRMFLQGRTWGARVLAWISGVVASGMMLLCGWTGLILVWDVQGHQLALEGARLLDLLPIFPEPIRNVFVGDETVSNSFFFANLFLHLAIPLMILAVLWAHVSRVSRPRLVPPKRLFGFTVLGLFLLSVLWPFDLAPRAQLNQLPSAYSIDWFFAFWLPMVVERNPWGAAFYWMLSGALLVSVPWWWRPKRSEMPQASTVNERLCKGCYQCYEDCPFNAISMVPRTVAPVKLHVVPKDSDDQFDTLAKTDPHQDPSNPDSDRVARVSPDLCVSCGICAGSCDVLRIGPPGRGGRDLILAVKAFCKEHRLTQESVLLFMCHQQVPTSKGKVPDGVFVFPIECTGNIHTTAIYSALRRDIGGVAIWSCSPRNCLFREGPKWLHARIYDGREAALPEKADRSKIVVLESGSASDDVLWKQVRDFQRTHRVSEVVRATSSSWKTWGLRIIVTAIVLGALTAATRFEYRQPHDTALLRLAWRHDAGLVKVCHQPTAEEQAALPMHMRRQQECEQRYLDYQLNVRLDGKQILSRIVEPGGAKKDRPPHILDELELPPGEHLISVSFDPVALPELKDVLTDAHRPKLLVHTQQIKAGSIYRVFYDRLQNRLVFKEK